MEDLSVKAGNKCLGVKHFPLTMIYGEVLSIKYTKTSTTYEILDVDSNLHYFSEVYLYDEIYDKDGDLQQSFILIIDKYIDDMMKLNSKRC